ncbi:MAG: beta-ketoacyl-[acyl-carrier-protein] synthase family protein [Candidatus Omnitrophica bacterium]|nr:beta-ketoacyl-[acyl-carrier-protein] synthase family protein [Candidatus Omnitrophota bacterium]
MKNKRVVITGIGVISSIGIGQDVFWKNLLLGKSGISKVTSFDTSNHNTHIGGEIKNFNPSDFMTKKRARLVGKTSQLAIAATRLALKDAGLDKKSASLFINGVCFGTTMGEIQALESADRIWIKSHRTQLEPISMYQSPANHIPTNVAIEFNIHGYNRIFTTACAAGNYALGFAYDLIRHGKIHCAVTGGADAMSWISFTGFNKVGATSPVKCQPFDKNRKGMIPGEGAGALIVEELDHAIARRHRIYAEILGYGLSCDSFHMTNPQVEGVERCMRNAIFETNTDIDKIDYICAHGTGTKSNDRTEATAINNIFKNRQVPTSSIKSMLGHTMGAASALEAITCCLAVKNDIIPPTINFETHDPECNIDCVPNKSRFIPVNIALNNAFAFGGNNSCVVIKKFK